MSDGDRTSHASSELFVRLSKYRPTHKRESFENFFTELIACLVEIVPTIGADVVSAIRVASAGDGVGLRSVRTQVPTRSRQVVLSGLYLDLVLELDDGTRLIVENKVEAALSKTQLDSYLAYAEEIGNTQVAVISKLPNRVSADCKHPLFRGEFYWSSFAERWSRLTNVAPGYLVRCVLELMRSRGMGPFERFGSDELDSYERWSSFQAKMAVITGELDQRMAPKVVFDTRGARRDRVTEAQHPGHAGIVWSAPRDWSPPDRPFWYFLGIVYGRVDWSLPLGPEGIPSVVAFVGFWTEKLSPEQLRVGLTQIAGPLLETGFELAQSENAEGLFLARHRPITEFLSHNDQKGEILTFLTDTSRRISESGVAGKLWQLHLRNVVDNAQPRK